ncbi:MAG TPA: hypothetical protein VFG69_12760 [Nannocystaceae bacterium]|nr:hypothetical protein [Nannocystaceae bacterium]
MPRPDRAPVIATALTMLLCGCDLFDKDKDNRTADDASMDEGGEDEMGEEETGGETGGADDGSGDGGGGGNSGEPLTPCQSCAANNCEEETMPCGTDQTCQDCAFGDASDPACEDNDAWQMALACACDLCSDACADIC